MINRAAVKKYIFAKLDDRRPHLGFTQISKAALDRYSALLKIQINKDIDQHPSKGKTFNPD